MLWAAQLHAGGLCAGARRSLRGRHTKECFAEKFEGNLRDACDERTDAPNVEAAIGE